MTHTPGPWRYEDGAFLGKDEPVFYFTPDVPNKVCVSPEDARLIAAAPALLEALREMTAFFGVDIEGFDEADEKCKVFDRALAAIALAKGEDK